MIVACYRPLPSSACMVYFDLVSILFGTSIPTSFNILVKMFLHLYIRPLRITCFNLQDGVCSEVRHPTSKARTQGDLGGSIEPHLEA